MINLVQAAVLGVVQGLTEFLPISSDGHLIVVPRLLGWPDQGLAFDIAVHTATLAAVFIYFRADWKNIWTSLRTKAKTRDVLQSRRLLFLIAIATIPGALAGAILANFLEDTARSLVITACLMIFSGFMFLVVERISIAKKDLNKITWIEALSIGVAQAGAILPGVSRSGSTITAAIYHGLKREAAARFSFLMSAPIILIAAVYYGVKLIISPTPLGFDWTTLAVGFAAALISGLIAIKFMMVFLKKYKLNIFSYYLIALGIALLGLNYFHVGSL